MMQDDQSPDDSWLFLPEADDFPESSPLVPPPSVEPPVKKEATTPALPPPKPRVAPRFALESLENPYRNYQPTPTHWAVGWADLMMTMFVLFLVLYLFQSAQQAQQARQGGASRQLVQWGQGNQQGQAGQDGKEGSGGKGSGRGGELAPQAAAPAATTGRADSKQPESARWYDLSKLTVEDKELSQLAEVELSPDRTVRIILAADLLFPSGNADLRSAAKSNIRKIAALLQTTPYLINVVGHTDNQPIRGGPFASNWELSVMRASAVARFLIDETGIEPSQFTVSGHSFYQPQAENDTPANRAKNRRVEIIVSKDQLPALPLAANPALIQ